MELQIAREIINVLAQGIHPVTGELMPPDSPLMISCAICSSMIPPKVK